MKEIDIFAEFRQCKDVEGLPEPIVPNRTVCPFHMIVMILGEPICLGGDGRTIHLSKSIMPIDIGEQ